MPRLAFWAITIGIISPATFVITPILLGLFSPAHLRHRSVLRSSGKGSVRSSATRCLHGSDLFRDSRTARNAEPPPAEVVSRRMRTHRAAFALALASTLATVPSLADTVEGTRFDIQEKAHLIEARLEHGHATLVVTRTVENDGPKSDQALFHIDLPKGAVATRLRTAGTGPNGETVWFEGELMEAEAAAQKYKELTGIGGYYPKDPALLSWRSQTHLALQVFPVPAHSKKTIEYTLRVPLSYDAGVYKLVLPPIGTGDLPAKVKLSAASPNDAIEVNGVGVGPTTAITASRELEITLTPRAAAPIEGALASFGFGEKRALVHGRIAAAPRISQVPAQASIVVLIDGSRSMESELGPEIVALRAYLSHFKNADVEVLTFDRAVHSPFGGPLPVKNVVAKLVDYQPTAANGSAIDAALARADEHLARSSAPAKRIVLLTDLRTRTSLTPEKFAARPLVSGAVVHLASVTSGGASLVRDDESPWAKLPRRTGGLYWKAEASSVDAQAREVFEEWARPKRISKLVVKGLPEDIFPEELKEGEGIEHLGIAAKPAAQLAIEGELWSRTFHWSTSPSFDETRRWAGLVFGSELLHELSETEQMTLALHGRAVSPVTSYLAIEPGVRPSTEGLTPDEVGLGGIGTIGHGYGTGSGRLFGAGRAPIDRQAFLDKALGAALATCGAKDEHARAVIESTLVEIVDVKEVVLTQRNAKVESCVTEELWKVLLPRGFEEEHMTWTATR